VNVSQVHYVYNYNVVNNRGGNRVSFNGGSGGIQVRARPAELAALHEQHAAPMSAQLQHEHLAGTNRDQFATVNRGRPASLVVSRPLAADHNMRVPAPQQLQQQPMPQQQQQQHPMPQQQQQHQMPQQQQQQHQMPQQPQQHQPAPQQQHQAPQPQQQQQQHQAPPQHQPAPEHPKEDHPKQ